MHPDWLSNAFVIADREGGTAVFVDSGADIGPLVAAVEEWGATPGGDPAHALALRPRRPRGRASRPLRDRRRRRARRAGTWGGLQVRGFATPGHSDDMVAFVVDDEVVFTGDTLFKDAVGGGDLAQVRASVMDGFMTLPDEPARPARAHRRDDDRPRARSRTRSSGSGAAQSPRARSASTSAAGMRRSSSGRPTTTARARPGFASTTAPTRSSAARASPAARPGSDPRPCPADTGHVR